jgi:hypothetical protein
LDLGCSCRHHRHAAAVLRALGRDDGWAIADKQTCLRSRVETVRMHNPVSNGKPFGPEFSRVTACNIGVL